MPPEAQDLIGAYHSLERELEGLISILETEGLPATSIDEGLAQVARSFQDVRTRESEWGTLEESARAEVQQAASRAKRLHGVLISQVSCEFDALRQKLGGARKRREQLDRLGELRAGTVAGGSCDVTG